MTQKSCKKSTYAKKLQPQQIFSDHCDDSGTMPKSKVATAARVLGQNPTEAQVEKLVSRSNWLFIDKCLRKKKLKL